MDHTQIGLAGEYYVLAQLAHRGLVGALTLSNTKGVDIFVMGADAKRVVKIEVKTTQKASWRESLFGEERFYMWPMGKKHETLTDKSLFYVFVLLSVPEEKPRFFIVSSEVVAKYVRWQHKQRLKSRKQPGKEISLRKFRIKLSDPDGHEDNWGLIK